MTATPRFGLIGAAGYIAPRHMQAIADVGGKLVVAMDRNDSVGAIDSHFPDASFFTEFERLDRHVDLLRRNGEGLDYISVCSPNYLHDSHVRFALRSGASAICEKPLVLNPWNISSLQEIERDSEGKVNTILQLRMHDSVLELKDQVSRANSGTKLDVDLTYITARGRWYFVSWKGDVERSGGIATNIGVHFFDMLHFVFGPLEENRLHYETASTAAGFLEYERARVRWFLSIDESNLPENARKKGLRTYRSIRIGSEEFEFSGGFADLHTKSYESILQGRGFGLADNCVAIETVSRIRELAPMPQRELEHPLLKTLRDR